MSEPANLFEITDVAVADHTVRVFQGTPASLRVIWDLSAMHGEATYLV